MPSTITLSDKVGPGASNRPVDVAYVQHYINVSCDSSVFVVNGDYTPELGTAIKAFFRQGFSEKDRKFTAGLGYISGKNEWEKKAILERRITPPPAKPNPGVAFALGEARAFSPPYSMAPEPGRELLSPRSVGAGDSDGQRATRTMGLANLEPPIFTDDNWTALAGRVDAQRAAKLIISQFHGDWYDGARTGTARLIEMMMADSELQDIRQMAYMLATAKHETQHSMVPNKEIRGGKNKDKKYWNPVKVTVNGVKVDRVFFGRGYVHLTLHENYQKATEALRKLGVLDAGQDLEANPELALEPKIAYACLARGMQGGWYDHWRQDRGLDKYIAGAACDYIGARRTVNVQDQAVPISKLAVQIEKVLRLSTVKG